MYFRYNIMVNIKRDSTHRKDAPCGTRIKESVLILSNDTWHIKMGYIYVGCYMHHREFFSQNTVNDLTGNLIPVPRFE